MGRFWAQLQCVDCLAFGERWVREGASLFGFYRETNACCEEMLEAGSRKGTESRLFCQKPPWMEQQLLYVKAKQALDLD